MALGGGQWTPAAEPAHFCKSLRIVNEIDSDSSINASPSGMMLSAMSADPELAARGRLVRRLSALREMLPGSFVERRRKCGKPNCRCADGQPEHLHTQFLLSVLSQGKLRTFHIPAELAPQTRSQVELHKQFQQVAAAICGINLRRLLRRKQNQGREEG
jgi:hypothetical protein